ncbi:hypothetical protein DFQ26_008140 [Actinomortierella ambigua]|nr:hypothetical protein DFQ26_008140 [Actinomortierella ambigua]
MPRLEWTTGDVDLLRKQEWRLLFASKQQSASGTPPSLSDATFLVKGYFAPAEYYYLLMVTDLQQCWIEKMELEDIRERYSYFVCFAIDLPEQSITTFDYDDDEQLEELLKTLESMFAKGHSPSAARRLELGDKNTLVLHDQFTYGIASGKWEFKLSPTVSHDHVEIQDRPTSDDSEDDSEDDIWGSSNPVPKYYRENPMFLSREQREYLREEKEAMLEKEAKLEKEPRRDAVDGPTLMYENLSLPLITVLNAYRKQVRVLESVIKSKEAEAKELIGLLDVNGIAHQQRHRATEPYRSKDAESPVIANVKSDVQKQIRPAASGPWDLFSDSVIQSLCGIASKNAANKSSHNPSQVPSSLDSLSQPISQNTWSSQAMDSLRPGTSSRHSERPVAAAPEQPASLKVDKQTKAEQEELERRKRLQERLEQERLEREKKPKKKKLF